MFKKILVVLLVFLMIETLLTGCGGNNSNTTSGKTTKDSVTMAIVSDIATLDPHNPTAILSRVAFQNMYEPLLDYHKGEFTPVLCEGYSVSDDGLRYTFKLKKGVKFHNGEEMKASDVVYSMLRAKSLPYMKNNTSDIKDVTAKDDYTVEISLANQYVPFLMSVGSQIFIVSEKAGKEYGENLKDHPVGTGPYKFVKWDAGQQVVMERFDNWHGGKVPIKTAIYKVIGDPSSSVVALETGEVDLSYNIPTISIKSLSDNPKITLKQVRTLGCGYLPLNLEKAPLDDVNFRMAINYAIDRKKVIDVALEGVGIISSGIWSDDTVGYSDAIKTYEYDPAKAKEYLAQTKYDGRAISYKIGYESAKKQATLIQEDLRAVGINIKIEQMEQNAWIQDMVQGNYEISSIVMTRAADADLWSGVFHSGAIDKELNFSRLKSKEVDSAFEAGKSILDPKERIMNYEKISRYLHNNAIIAPLYFKVATPAYAKDLKIAKFYADGYAKVKDMSWQ